MQENKYEEFFERAKKGDNRAQLILSHICLHGKEGREKDEKEAKKWLHLSSLNGNKEAYSISRFMDGEELSFQDYTNYIENDSKEVAQNKVESHEQDKDSVCNRLWFEIASIHEKRKKTDDMKRAMEIYELLSAKGHEKSTFRIAYLCNVGIAGKKDLGRAKSLYESLSAKGNERATHNLALMWKSGEGVDKNLSKAFKLFRLGASTGFLPSILSLASAYRLGEGVEVDHNKMFEYFSAAADKGSAEAFYELSECFRTGQGVHKNEDKMIEMLRKSAEKGSTKGKLKKNSVRNCFLLFS